MSKNSGYDNIYRQPGWIWQDTENFRGQAKQRNEYFFFPVVRPKTAMCDAVFLFFILSIEK